jgi:hypothetical protein
LFPALFVAFNLLPSQNKKGGTVLRFRPFSKIVVLRQPDYFLLSPPTLCLMSSSDSLTRLFNKSIDSRVDFNKNFGYLTQVINPLFKGFFGQGGLTRQPFLWGFDIDKVTGVGQHLSSRWSAFCADSQRWFATPLSYSWPARVRPSKFLR